MCGTRAETCRDSSLGLLSAVGGAAWLGAVAEAGGGPDD